MTFSHWFTKANHNNDVNILKNFPNILMDSHDKSVINWCLDYNEKYGSLPPLETIKNEAPNGNLYIVDFVPKENVKKLFSEAKRQLAKKRIKEIDSEFNSIENPNYTLRAQKVLRIESYLNDIKPRNMDELEDLLYSRPKNIYTFKYKKLNDAVNALLGGELCFFVAPEKSKKTWVLLDLAKDAVYEQNKNVYVYSNELSESALAQRLHAMIGEFNPNVYRLGTQKELNECRAIYSEKKKELDLTTSGKFIFPSSYFTTYQEVIGDIRKTKPDMVCVDSAHAFLDTNGRPIEDNWGELTAMIRSFKQLSMELGIQILCNSQFKGGVKGVPTSDDIALTKSIARTSDLVIGMMPEDSNNVEKVTLNILASRNSSNQLSIQIEFDFDTCKFSEYVPRALQQSKMKYE